MSCPQLHADKGGWDLLSAVSSAGPVVTPNRMATDAAGNLYVADPGAGLVLMRDPQGRWTTLAASGDGPEPPLAPLSVAVDAKGGLYVGESTYGATSRIRMRDAQGQWSVLATGGSGLGQVSSPADLAVSPSGDLLVADSGNWRVQRRTPEGAWSVIGDRSAKLGGLGRPTCLDMDSQGTLYVGGSGLHRRDALGNWTGVTGDPRYGPIDLCVDAEGNLYQCGPQAGELTRLDPQGTWVDLAIYGKTLGYIDVPASLAIDRDGNLYVGDRQSSLRIQRRDPLARWSVLATLESMPGPAGRPASLAADGAGNLYVADRQANRVLVRRADGIWSEVAAPGLGLGQVTAPRILAADQAGDLYVADTTGLRLQRRDARGRWGLVDGPSHGIDRNTPPTGLTCGAVGTLYLAQGSPPDLLAREVSGAWRSVGSSTLSRDALNTPQWMAADAEGTLYEAAGHIVLAHRPDGSTVVVGSEATGLGGLGSVTSVAVDPAGTLFAANPSSGAPLHLRTRSGQWVALPGDSTVTGTEFAASLLAADGQGNVYVSDGNRLARYRLPSHLLTLTSAAVSPGADAQEVTVSVRILPNSGPVTSLEMSLLESAPAGAPGISSITYSLGADAADWQLQTEIPNPRRVVVSGTRGIEGPAELLRVTYGLPAGLPAGVRYALTPFQPKVSAGGQEVISTQPLIDGGVLRVLGYRPGDVNADGLIDLQDALLCLRIAVLGADPSLPDAPYAADVDGNVRVTAVDALLILRRVLLGTPFPSP
jgi:sugar lactone lactonase YvrE